jgi:hypothetical protein
MRCDIYFDAIEGLAKEYIEEIDSCAKDLHLFAEIYKRKLETGEDSSIDIEIERKLKLRKSEAENELGAIKGRFLNLQRSIANEPISRGIKVKGGNSRTFNIDPT